MKGLVLAFQFLTRIPIPISVDFNEKNIAQSSFFYGLVGMVLGGIYALIFFLFNERDPWVCALITTFSMVFFTGGLHLDGLSDMADGFFSGRDKEESFKIMKDSRVGTFGVLALIFLIMSKVIIISRLDSYDALFFASSHPRFILPLFFMVSKSPTQKGLAYLEQKTNYYSLIPTVIYIIVLIWKFTGNLPTFGAILIWMLIIRAWANKKIGGVNGDIYGAFVEISETIILFLNWRFV